MKIHSIKYKNITQPPPTLVEENINILSSARVILDLDIDEDINYVPRYNITGNYSEKWRLNSYGMPVFLTKKKSTANDVELDYFTISSNIIDTNDYDMIEYAGLQLGEIENNYFSKLLCYNSDIVSTFRNPHNNSNSLLRIFDEIDDQVAKLYKQKLYPKFVVCDSFSLLKIFAHHPTFKAVSANYRPHVADIIVKKEPVHIVTNNMIGNDIYSNICLCADLVGAMHVKGGVQNWQNQNQAIFTETIGMAIFEENGIKRFVIEKG